MQRETTEYIIATTQLLTSPTKYVFSVYYKKVTRIYCDLGTTAQAVLSRSNLDNGTIEGTIVEGTGYSVTNAEMKATAMDDSNGK